MDIKLTKKDKIQILNSDTLYIIMQRILMRENEIDRDREHFWVVGLSQNNTILFIELIGLGTVKAVLVEPMEVYSFALQKRAVKIMLVHNHPSGNLTPSKEDKDITDQMIQVGKLLQTPVIDHLIISEETYFSFEDTGLLEELSKSTKYVPHFLLQQQLKVSQDKLVKAAQALHKKGASIDEIKEATGLLKKDIRKIIKE